VRSTALHLSGKARIVAQLSLVFKPRKSPHLSSDLIVRKPGNNRIESSATTIVPRPPISTAGTAPTSPTVILDLPTDFANRLPPTSSGKQPMTSPERSSPEQREGPMAHHGTGR